MNPNIPERMLRNRPSTPDVNGSLIESFKARKERTNRTNDRISTSRMLDKITSDTGYGGRGINIESISTIIELLRSMTEALIDIKNSNNIISEKNYSPNVSVTVPSTGGIGLQGNQKSNIVDSIISGIWKNNITNI